VLVSWKKEAALVVCRSNLAFKIITNIITIALAVFKTSELIAIIQTSCNFKFTCPAFLETVSLRSWRPSRRTQVAAVEVVPHPPLESKWLCNLPQVLTSPWSTHLRLAIFY
jgi:hypothetical protein